MSSPPNLDVRSRRTWLAALVVISLAGLGIRLGMVVLVEEPSSPGFLVNYDPIFYHRQANLLADGRGFIAPYLLDEEGRGPERPSAGHPPMLSIVLAGGSVLGFDGFREHRAISAVLGALAVPLIGLLAAELAGRAVGLVAAALAAVHPNLWGNDGLIMPESLYAALIAAILLLALRYRRRPSAATAAGLGLTIGIAALTRGEGLLLLGLLVVPLLLLTRGDDVRLRLKRLGAAAAACAVVLLPWTLYNSSRFEEPVLISTAADTTFAGANCDRSYYGPGLGLWAGACFADIEGKDESVRARRMRREAVDYVRDHVGRLPVVGAARLGRLWDVYRPSGNVTLNELQNRPRAAAWAGLFGFYALIPAAVYGAFVLRERRGDLFPLVAIVVSVTLTGLLFYGNVRFRVPVEIVLVVLAAVGLVDLARRLLGAQRLGRLVPGGPP
jgi:hypothetical protein